MAGMGRVLVAHDDAVWRVRTDPEGVRVASASHDGTVRVLSLDGAGGAVETLGGHAQGHNSVCWSRGGHQLISGSPDGKVRVFDASNLSAPPKTIDVGGGGVYSVDCGGADGLILTGCVDGGIRVVSAAEGRVVREVKGAQHMTAVWAVNWSPSGTRFASGDNACKVWVWSAATWSAERELAGHSGHVFGSVRWSSDSERIVTACWGDHKVRIFLASTGALERTLEGSGMQRPFDADWSPDGHFVAVVGDDTKVRVWDVRTGAQVRCFEGHSNEVSGVCWGAGDVIVSGGGDLTVRAWSVSDLCEPTPRRREREGRERREAEAARERLEAEAARRAEVEALVAPERRAKEAALAELADVSAREERTRAELQREREARQLLENAVAELTQQRDAANARLQEALLRLRQLELRGTE
jgi:WD40 repeat protein